MTFYKSGDKHYKGLPMSVSQKQFVTFETLLDFLSSKIPTTKGVKTVFSWPDCKVGQLYYGMCVLHALCTHFYIRRKFKISHYYSLSVVGQ